MAYLDETFEVTDSDESSVIQAGWYNSTIKTVELKNTKAETGQYLNIMFSLDDNRSVYTMVNIKNPNAIAQEIGRKKLNQMCKSIGIKSVSNTDVLIGSRLMIEVIIKKSEEYGDRNDIKNVKPASSMQPVKKDNDFDDDIPF